MTGIRRTWSLEDFHGGIDLRDGDFSANQTRCKELKNLRVTKGKKLRRRPPCLQVAGALSSNTQGLVMIDGQLYTFAKKGDTVSHTSTVASTVQTLAFDNPDLATTWTLLTAGVFDGYAAALIRHDYPSTAYPSFVALHVWDGLVYAPTWVQDPYFPGSFAPSIADLSDQTYSATFRPVLGQGATKLWSSTNEGNAHCCRTADARVWNQRTKDSLLQDGEHWCFVVPEGQSINRLFVVPRDCSWLVIDGAFAYYVLEYDNNGAWTPMAEVSGVPSVDWTWRPVSTTSRFAGGWNEITIQVRWGRASAGLIRLRLVAGATSLECDTDPSVTVVPAVGGSGFGLAVGSYTYRYRGAGSVTVGARNTAALASGKTYLLGLTSDYSGFPELWNETDNGFPNGWEREHRKIIKRIVAPTTATGSTAVNVSWQAWSTISTTGSCTAGSPTFNSVAPVLSTLHVGMPVRIAGLDTGTVSGLIDANNCDATPVWPTTRAYPKTIEVQYNSCAFFDGTNTQINLTGFTPAAGQTIQHGANQYTVISAVGQIAYIAGNHQAEFDAVVTVSLVGTPVVSDYAYAFKPAANSTWYTYRLIEYIDQAGAEDALSIATASHDNTGGLITSISSARQRMLITYAGSTQLWSIDQNTNRTAYLDTLNFGAGEQVTPPAVAWYGSIVIPVSTGVRAISVVGANTDNLQDLNVGEPIDPLPDIALSAGVFWPHYGQVVLAGVSAGALEFRVLDYSRESKITAWSQWSVVGVAGVDTDAMLADGPLLWFRSGTTLWRFDAAATAFRDSQDPAGAGNAYQSKARLLFNDMGKPGQSKRFVGLDIVQTGTCSMQFLMPPYGASFAADGDGPAVAGPSIEGITYGMARYPMAMNATAIAPVLTSTDETGWELQRLAIDFINLRR